jgi:hypothetical protein
MSGFKKYHKMIELHNNVDLTNVIKNDKSFDPLGSLFKNSYLYASVYCDNFEAFKMLINHPKFLGDFNSLLLIPSDWLELILEKYSILSNAQNSLYLDELLKLNLTFSDDCVRKCPNLETFKKIMDNLDWTNKTQILQNTLFDKTNDDIQLFIVEKLLSENIEIFTKQFVDQYVLNYSINYSKIGIIELLQNFNIDIKYINDLPSIIYCINNNEKLIKYFSNKNFHYDDNLLSVKYFNELQFGPNYLHTFEKILEYNIGKYFTKCSDDDYVFLNYFVSNILFNKKYVDDYYYRNVKDIELIKSFHFIIASNNNKNVYDHIDISNFERMFLNTDKKQYDYKLVFSLIQRNKTKIFLGCLLCYDFKIPEQFQEIMNVVFGNELKDIDRIRETYKMKEIVVVKPKPKKTNKKKEIEI